MPLRFIAAITPLQLTLAYAIHTPLRCRCHITPAYATPLSDSHTDYADADDLATLRCHADAATMPY